MIRVVCVGRARGPLAEASAEYEERLARTCKFELHELREEGTPSLSPREAMLRERAQRRIPADAYVSLLAADGQALDSIGLARFIAERRMSRRDLCFVVGGPFGVELERADHRLSLGRLTLPHQLARVVLLEQLYRAHKIIAREPYHH